MANLAAEEASDVVSALWFLTLVVGLVVIVFVFIIVLPFIIVLSLTLLTVRLFM